MNLTYLELIIDGHQISLNEFAQNILINLNLAYLELLNLPNNIKNRNEIDNFEVNIQRESKNNYKTVLNVNSNNVTMKPFVQNILKNYNLGIIQCYSDIPKTPKIYKIFYRRT
jgi:hypothetical protein